jgi:hypothetical protein
MAFQVGDRVVAESESTERSARYGTVREVVHEDPHARYRIEWMTGARASTRWRPARSGARRAGQAGGVTHDSSIAHHAPGSGRGSTVASAPPVGSRHSEPPAVRRNRHSAFRRHSARPRCTTRRPRHCCRSPKCLPAAPGSPLAAAGPVRRHPVAIRLAHGGRANVTVCPQS